MGLNFELLKNNAAVTIVDTFRKKSKSSAEDVAASLNLLYSTSKSEEEIEERLSVAENACLHMEIPVDHIVALLLHVLYRKNKISLQTFKKTFKEGKSERYFEFLRKMCSQRMIPCPDEWDQKDETDYIIMLFVCDKMFNAMVRNMNKKGVPDTECIMEAYKLAKKAHYGVTRKSGEPYLTHPISVAKILAEIGVESQIVAAALLHDVVEDTDYTLEDVSEKCSPTIAKYVDAVTSVHKEYESSHNMSEYSNDKGELDARSFEKLVRIVSEDEKMVYALYIKAADRVHNLRTIDKMSNQKKHDKTDETELDYLPLFKRFHLNYFVNIIEDLTWGTNNKEYYESIKVKYEKMLSENSVQIDKTKCLLSEYLGERFKKHCHSYGMEDADYDISVSERTYLIKEVYNFLKAKYGEDSNISAKDITKKTVPICDFDIIVSLLDEQSSMDNMVMMFIKMFNEHIAPTGRTIIDIINEPSAKIIEIVDELYNVYRLCFFSEDEYYIHRLGSRKGSFQPESDDEEDAVAESVFVKLRNGNQIELPIGSTALDVAFAIHPEVGLCAKYALINEQKTSIYSMVHEGDKIIIVADTSRKDGVTQHFTPHVRISWLLHVKTNKAKKAIVNRLSDKYSEGEDPNQIYDTSDTVSTNVSKMVTEALKDNEAFVKAN